MANAKALQRKQSAAQKRSQTAWAVSRLRHGAMARYFLSYGTHPDPVESASIAEVSAIAATFRMVEEINFKVDKRLYTVDFKLAPQDGGRFEMANLEINEWKD